MGTRNGFSSKGADSYPIWGGEDGRCEGVCSWLRGGVKRPLDPLAGLFKRVCVFSLCDGEGGEQKESQKKRRWG